MNDQAKTLRQLARDESRSRHPESEDRPWVIAVTAGKGGIGTTTVAVNLALALVQSGSSCALIDGNAANGDATMVCGLEADGALTQVAAGWRSVEESLVEGPGGLRILPGGWAASSEGGFSEGAQTRLVEELQGLGHAEFIVIDAGSGLAPYVGRFWRAADLVLVVTTPDPMPVMDAYAAIKVHSEGATTAIHILVNRAADIQSADEVHARLARACQRFLGLSVADAGYLPCITRHDPTKLQDELFVLNAPDSTATLCVQRLTQAVLAQRGRGNRALERRPAASLV